MEATTIGQWQSKSASAGAWRGWWSLPAQDWHSDYAGDAQRGGSETFRRDAQRGATQHNESWDRTWLASQASGIEKAGSRYDGRWYVLLCNRVHLGMSDKMSALYVNLWLESHAFDIVICKLIRHWRIGKLQRCIERLEHRILGRGRKRHQRARCGRLRKQWIFQERQVELLRRIAS